MKTLLLAVAVLLVAMIGGLAGCGEASSGYDYVAEPRRVPEPKTCSDYANSRQILIDEQAGKLTKSDKEWLDMDGDGRYCKERGVVWKGERAHEEHRGAD
jgi:type IV pilus biogenesis protein CpaD/CtpE